MFHKRSDAALVVQLPFAEREPHISAGFAEIIGIIDVINATVQQSAILCDLQLSFHAFLQPRPPNCTEGEPRCLC